MEILLVTTDWKSVGEGESCMQIKLTLLKNDILNMATRSVATGEPPRSKSFTCGPDHQLLRIKLSRELTIPTKVLHHVPGTRECSNRAPRVLGFIC